METAEGQGQLPPEARNRSPPPKDDSFLAGREDRSGVHAVSAPRCSDTLVLSLCLQMDVIFMALFVGLNIQIDSLFPFLGLFWEGTDNHHPPPLGCEIAPLLPQAD